MGNNGLMGNQNNMIHSIVRATEVLRDSESEAWDTCLSSWNGCYEMHKKSQDNLIKCMPTEWVDVITSESEGKIKRKHWKMPKECKQNPCQCNDRIRIHACQRMEDDVMHRFIGAWDASVYGCEGD